MPVRISFRPLTVIPALILTGLLGFTRAHGDEEILERGRKIYQETCADCHGEQGEGVEGLYDDPLVGDATIGELTKQISATMPEGDAEACVGEDAASVASFIHHAFYSEAARIRNRPPRVSMVRLTAEQLRQSLADLHGRFQPDPYVETRRGVEAIYFDGARWKEDKKKIERIDATIDFDFGDNGPGEDINPKEFYIHWGGSLRVNHTGRYEIILRSTCSCLMYFGNTRRELINNHVQSEGKEEFRQTLHLTAGRNYPFKIELFQRKRKTEQPPAKISLSWKPPGGVEQIVPPDNLVPAWLPSQFALQAKLPPDDRSYGYERGIAVNRQWDQSTTAAAFEFAQLAVDELWPEYRRKHRNDSDENRQRLRDFLTELVQTAQRGPLDETARKLYIDKQLEATADDAEAIRRVALITLKSPRFLYPALDQDRSKSQRAANTLALILHDSLPSDNWLMQRIAKNQIQTEKQIGDVAWRMAGDDRAINKMRQLIYRWVDLSELEDISKDQEKYPGFDRALVADLRRSFDAFLDDVIRSETSDYRQLLQADWAYTSDRIAAYYGDTWQPAESEEPASGGEGLSRSVNDPTVRAGVLTHPLLTSSFSHHNASSPIHRGVMLYRYVLGRTLRPPNAAFTPLNPDLHPKLTTRQRVELQTADSACQVCHQKINSLGFALENYDSVGRYRIQENEQSVDTAGAYVDRTGKQARFRGPRELADYLAASDDCHRAFVEAAFEHFVKQPIAAYGPETGRRLTQQFKDTGFNIRGLIVNIAITVATHPVEPTDT